MSNDALPDTVTPSTLGPYVLAASTIHGPAAGDVAAHVSAVVQTGVKLLVAAQQAARDAVRDIPIRSYSVTGILSVENTRNANRTQIGIDTGQSNYGPDRMWTDYEDEAAAARTRAVLQSQVGRTVTATKQTFVEYDHSGEIVLTDKGERQTRTRLAAGSLCVVGGDGAKTMVDFVGAGSEQEKPPYVDAARTYALLVERVGAERAAQGWGALPRTGEIAREQAAAAFRVAATAAA